MTCLHCGEPIRRVFGGWVHDGPGGGYPCRDRVCGAWLETMAAPVPQAPAVGRHRVRSGDAATGACE